MARLSVPAGATLSQNLSQQANWAGGPANSDSTATGSSITDLGSNKIEYLLGPHPAGLGREELDSGGNANTGSGALLYNGHYWIEYTVNLDAGNTVSAIPSGQGGVNLAQIHSFFDAAAMILTRLYRDTPGGTLWLRQYVSGGAQSGNVYVSTYETTIEAAQLAKDYIFQIEMIMSGNPALAMFRCYVNGTKLDFGQGTDNILCGSTETAGQVPNVGGRHARLRNGIYFPGNDSSSQFIEYSQDSKIYTLVDTPSLITTPVTSGSPAVGQVVVCDGGLWTGRDLTLGYQWQRSTDGGSTWVPISPAGLADTAGTVSNQIATVNALQVIQYTVSADATIDAITAYLTGGTSAQQFRPLVYNDSSGYPGTLLATGPEVTIAISQAAGYVTIPLASSINVTAGQVIYLGLWRGGTGGAAGAFGVKKTAGSSINYLATGQAYASTGNPVTTYPASITPSTDQWVFYASGSKYKLQSADSPNKVRCQVLVANPAGNNSQNSNVMTLTAGGATYREYHSPGRPFSPSSQLSL